MQPGFVDAVIGLGVGIAARYTAAMRTALAVCVATLFCGVVCIGRAEAQEARPCPPGFHCEALPEDEASTPEGPVEQPAAEAAPPEQRTEERSVDETADAPPAPPPPSPRPLMLAPQQDVPRPPPPNPRAWGRFRLVPRVGVPVFDSGASSDAAMLAAGLGLRYAPQRKVEFEMALDGAAGTDYVGADRQELWASGSVVLRAGPRGVVPYVLLGPALSFAHSDLDGVSRNFAYLGVHLGIGLAIELSARTSLTIDWLAFARGRIDGRNPPEYVDLRTGRHTNTSGGGLLRLGASFEL